MLPGCCGVAAAPVPSYGMSSFNQSRPRLAAADFETHGIRLHVVLGLFGIWHLARVHRDFEGDLLSALILGEVAHHNIVALASADGARLDPVFESLGLKGAEARLLPCNVHSIAMACDIPRETVRRKVAALVDRGWLQRNAKSELFVTSLPAEHFREFNVEFANRLLEAADQIRSIVSPR